MNKLYKKYYAILLMFKGPARYQKMHRFSTTYSNGGTLKHCDRHFKLGSKLTISNGSMAPGLGKLKFKN